jgi:hypothetical protein
VIDFRDRFLPFVDNTKLVARYSLGLRSSVLDSICEARERHREFLGFSTNQGVFKGTCLKICDSSGLMETNQKYPQSIHKSELTHKSGTIKQRASG